MATTKSTKKQDEKIRLRASSTIEIINDYFIVLIEALVIKDGKAMENCGISFYDGINIIDSGNTASGDPTKNGIFLLRYEIPVSEAGKEITINARINDSGTESSVIIFLPKTKEEDWGKGAEKIKKCFYHNINARREKIWAHVIKTSILFLPLAFMTAFFKEKISLIIALVIGLAFYKLIESKTISITAIVSTFSIAFFFPKFFTSSIFFSSSFMMTIGLLAYLAEELTYVIEITKDDGGKVHVKWVKWINFFPNFPVIICLLAILYHLLSLIGVVIPDNEISIIKIGNFIPDSDFLYGYETSTGAIANHLIWVINWLVAVIVTIAYAIPGEIMAIIGQRESVREGSLKILERILFLKEISGIASSMRRK